MSFGYIPVLEIFLGILGFGLFIVFCTTFCRVCSRIREEQIEMEARRRVERDGPPRSIYFIPFPRNLSQDSEDPRYSQENHMPPRYSTSVYNGPPPAYNELGFKPEDLPPAYTENSPPVYPSTPPPHINTIQPSTESQQ